MDTIVKSMGDVVSKPDVTDSPFGAFQVILSTPTEDRDGDQLLTSEWELPLPDHITFDIDHGMSVATTVGSGTPSINDKGELVVDGTYASIAKAQEVRSLVNEGHIRTVSVAFLTKTSKDASGKTKVTRELLNGAFVAIPANPEAVIMNSKSANSVDTKALIDAKKKSILGSIEALHDRVVDAIEDTYEDECFFIRGIIPAGTTGKVVYDVYDMEDWECETFQESFSDDGSVVTLAGDRKEVDILEVVLPNADEARDNEKSANADAIETAEKSAVDTASAVEDDSVEVFARALSIQAEALSL